MNNHPRQTIVNPPNEKPMVHGWREMRVRTTTSYDDNTASEVTLKTAERHEDGRFLDVLLTEYVGESRRAKMTSVRLQEPAARALYDMLRWTFGS